MEPLFASGRVVDLILLMVAGEMLCVVAWRRWCRRGGLAPDEMIRLLLPGVCLLGALRGALVGAWWGWIAAWLLAALVAHVWDLARRWGR